MSNSECKWVDNKSTTTMQEHLEITKKTEKRTIIIESALKASIISSILLAMVLTYYFSVRNEIEMVFQFVNCFLFIGIIFNFVATILLTHLYAQIKKEK